MFLDHKIDPMNRSLRYWRVAAIPGVMIPVDVHILLAWNHQFSERFDEGKADRTRLWLQGEEAQKDATMGYWAIFGIWLLTAALVFEFFGSVSQLKENGRCVYYLYISIHNYTILYYIYYIYISYIALGVRVKLTHSLGSCPGSSCLRRRGGWDRSWLRHRWRRNAFGAVDQRGQRGEKPIGSVEEKMRPAVGLRDLADLGLTLRYFSISWRFFWEFPDHNPIGSLADEA